MGFSVIIKLLLMAHILYARIELFDIKIASETHIRTRNNLLISQDGPLSLLRGYIMHRSGYMYNKRLFSSGIDIDYSMKKSAKSIESIHVYTYTRQPEKDKAHVKVAKDGAKADYFTNFHQQLIYMFPCESGILSIESSKADSFTRFLRTNRNRLDTLYLLAALLLLSEGIDVPIVIENNEIEGTRIFLQYNSASPALISLSLWLDSIVVAEAEEQMQSTNSVLEEIDLYIRKNNSVPKVERAIVYQKETEEIVQFFLSLCDKTFLSDLKMCDEPDTQEEFNNGSFLDNPKFLIQSYIFEYIDNLEQYMLFVDCVYGMLQYLLSYKKTTEQQKEQIERAMDYFFIDKNLYISELNYTVDICDLKSKIDKEAIIPFTCSEMMPTYTRVPEYEYISDDLNGHIQDELLQYSDHVETMLLNLFTCLTYNPETNKCSAENMPGASTTLIEFFNKYSVLTESASQTKHRDWCKVVSRLNNPKIRYVRESRTELCGGLENILYVISELFIEDSNILTGIERVINSLYNIEEETKRINDMQWLLVNVLNSLAINCQISIDSSSLEYLPSEGQAFDIFGSVVLSFHSKDRKECVQLDILPKHSKLSLVSEFIDFSEEIKGKLIQIRTKYNLIKSYTLRIIWNYLNNSIQSLEKITPKQSQYILNTIMKGIEHTPNQIFMYGRIDSLDYKTAIVKRFLINSRRHEFRQDNPILRIAENIIGSVYLNRQQERKKMLSACVCNLAYKKQYSKRLDYDTLQLPVPELDADDIRGLLNDTLDASNSKEFFYNSFYNILSHSICYREAFNIFGVYTSFRTLCVMLVEKYGLTELSQAMQYMREHIEPYNPHILNYIWFLWLSYACRASPYNKEVVGILYRHLDPTGIPLEYIGWVENREEMHFGHILHILNTERDIFCVGKSLEKKEKHERVISLFQRQISYAQVEHLS
ncbi:hypothetical protein NEIRO03_1778 [Nematocida sp. AWRm78]|nr:hypothetical protein NEIRO02_1648 [Nematocida sp. AWRm79]KAI5184650.1 hypothetical protein NEIRO03_1778 [Nematocida sp. AWRm78]